MSIRRSLIVSAVTVAVVATVPALTTVSAQALGPGSQTTYTLEGCRASATVYPINGPFVCPDGDYTTGNLGGGWNELDLVPGRVTVGTSNSAPSPQSFTFLVSDDACSTSTHPCTGTPGYDRLSTLTLNAAKSSASGCGTATVGAESFFQDQIYRQVDVSGMQANKTCVYDFFSRLALGSSGFPGASLHYHLKNETHGTQGIGNKDISIPVKDIGPFVFEKVETANQGADAVWTVSKDTTGGPVAFTDTCLSTAGKNVTVTVSWDKTVTGGAITVDGAITVGNVAHRPLNISISDQLYDGTDQSSPDGAPKLKSYTPFDPLTQLTYHDIWSPPANVASSYNDIASGTVTDPVFGDQISLSASDSADVVQGDPSTGDTAVITDVEALTDGTDPTSTTPATDYTFKVTSTSGASGTLYSTFVAPGDPGNVTYTLNTDTTGPLTWVSGSQSDDGSVTFNKTINVTQATTEDATLHDTATIAPDQQVSTTDDASIAVSAGATVEIDISKTTSIALDNDNTFTFNAYAPGHGPNPPGDGVTAGSTTVKIPAGSTGPVVSDPGITGLEPGVKYLVDEPALSPFLGQSVADVEVDLPDCSTTLNLTNENAPASAQVKKATDPLGSTTWTFTLTGVMPDGTTPIDDLAGGTSEVLNNVTANDANYAVFLSNLDIDGGTYTITETTQTHWDNTDVDGDLDGDAVTTSTSTHTCSVKIDLSLHSGGVFECTFTNVQESKVTVVKTQDGGTPTNQYSFRLTGGPDSISVTKKTNDGENPVGTLDFGYQKPGNYTLCELAVPAGTHSTLQDAPYNGALDGVTGDVCYSFTLAAGSDIEFDIDNVLPKGNALTIGYWKHWNSINVGKSIGAGNKLMDAFLPISLGPYVVGDAQTGVNVLNVPSMKWAENGLAAQLLAAKLNVASGALTCAAITTAISHADSLLNGIGYDGPAGNNVVGNKHAQRADFVSTASTLDQYNNNILC